MGSKQPLQLLGQVPFHSCSCLAISRNGFTFCMLHTDKWHVAINSTMGEWDLLPLDLAAGQENLGQWALVTLSPAMPG